MLDLLFPPRCLACTVSLAAQEEWLCLACEDALPRFENQPWDQNELAKKLWGRLPLGAGLALYQYHTDSEVQKLLHALKYHDRREACHHFGRLLGRLYSQEKNKEETPPINLVGFVPMHRSKLRRRGYNQAEVIARGFSEETGIPLFEGLSKLLKTESQTRKSRAARIENQRGAFALGIHESIVGLHIILIDDVVTTGATIEQAAIPLVEAGARMISVGAIANA